MKYKYRESSLKAETDESEVERIEKKNEDDKF
jgi:hypothetical protein